jgi:hypothetical protein
VEKVGGRSSIHTHGNSSTFAKGKKSKSIGIRYEYCMSGRTFTRSRVGEHDLSISRKHTHVGEGYDDTG